MEERNDIQMTPQQEAIGDNSAIRIGLAVVLVTMISGGVWWAAGVQSDLNAIKTQVTHLSELDTIKGRVTVMEEMGPKPLRDRLGAIETEIVNLRRDFEMHRMQSEAYRAITPTGKAP